MITAEAPPSVAARPLFDALYGYASEESWLHVWASPSKDTHWFTADEEGITAALAQVDKWGDRENVFMSMSLTGKSKRKNQRAELADVTALCALWIDVDVKAKPPYPQNLSAARSIIDAMPMRPSAIISSGGGLHGYWFFPEPLAMETADERADVLDMLKRWKVACQAAAASLGYTVDSVFDAPRIMRIPYTWNLKSKPPTQASIVEINPSLTYGQLDIEPYLPDAPDLWVKGKAEPISMVGIDLRSITTKPEKVILALEGDPKFKQTWERKRKDFSDQSSSSYCFSLAQYFVKLGLPDEQIVQLLYTWRADNGAVAKGDAWYAKEVGRARQAIGIESSTAEFVEAFKAGEVEEKSEVLKGLSQVLGFQIDRFQKIDGPKVTYRITVAGKDRNIGPASNITNLLKFRDEMFGLDVTVKEFSKKEWAEVLPLFIAAAETRVLGEGGTERGRAEGWLADYLGNHRLVEDLEPKDAFKRRLPILHNGDLAVFSEVLLQYVRRTYKSEAALEPDDMEQALEQAGCVQVPSAERYDFYPSGGRARPRPWIVPGEMGQG